MLEWNVNKAMLPKCPVNHWKCLVNHLVNKPMWVLRSHACSDGHVNKEIPYIRCMPHHFLLFVFQQPCRYHLKKRKLIHIRHCKCTQRWCVGLLHDRKVKYLSEPKLISVAIGKRTKVNGYYRCIALLDKYYGHRRYCIQFAHKELRRRNSDARAGRWPDLVDLYTREEIEVEYVLDCFYAEYHIQRTPDAYNILANSILKFIWKIAGRSMDYTTLNFWNKLKKYGGLWHRTSCFNDFIWAFNNKWYDEVLSIANGVLFCICLQETGEDQNLWSRIRLWGWSQYCTAILTLTKKGGWDIPVSLEECLDQGNILSILPSNHKPQVTLRPLSAASGGSVLVQDQPRSKIGTFTPSRATSNMHIKVEEYWRYFQQYLHVMVWDYLPTSTQE